LRTIKPGIPYRGVRYAVSQERRFSEGALIFSRTLTIERTRAGLEVARQLGRVGGRKRQMTESKIKSAKKLLASGVPPKDVASNLGVSVPTLYRWIPASTNL